jgi:hypothetical protein
MKENSAEKHFVSESNHPAISCNTKKNWQAPKLIEIDYTATNLNVSGADDGGTLGEDLS